MKNKDERMKMMSEILSGIKVNSGVETMLSSSCIPLLTALYLEAVHLYNRTAPVLQSYLEPLCVV